MATNTASLNVSASGPRKRKLSVKASTNGDPLQAPKRKKTLSTVNKGATAALTKNKTTTVTSKTATGTSNAAPNRVSKKVSGNDKQKNATIENVDSADDITMDDVTSNLPHNHGSNLDAADGSDDESNPTLGDDDSEKEGNDKETDLDEEEESAENELGRKPT
jgi:hypothetical protein